MVAIAQRSFAGGELAPALYARVDQSKYVTGLKTCRNFFVMRHGGTSNRPGTIFDAEVKDSSKTVRLIPFIFNADQTYVLEFGNLYMRVHRSGAQVTLTAQNITGVTNANPAVLTYAGADTYANGDEVFITGIVGPIGTYLNGRNFRVANVNAGANTFELQYLNGSNVNSTSFGAYTSGGTVAEIYEIATPYVEADLPTLQFVQSADVITIVHPNYAPRDLARTAHTSWTLTVIDFSPGIDRPTGCTGTAGGAGANTYRYKITAIDGETGEESLSGLNTTTRNITNITQANPAVVTSNAHGFANGDVIYITGVTGMTQVNGREYFIANVAANTFELKGVDSTGYTAYSANGTANRVSIVLTSAAAPSAGAPHALSWALVSGAAEYNVYKEMNGVYGLIGVAGDTSFNDTNIEADTTDTPPGVRNPFDSSGNYPSTVTYVQQRRVFGNTNNDPEKIWATRSGQFTNLTTSSPVQDDDAITFTLAGRQVNSVRHLLEIGKLIALTSGGEWVINGDQAGILKPTAINASQESYYGSATLSPIIIGGNALYLQARGSIIRDLAFELQSDGYRGNDLTIFSAHLFDGYMIDDWAFQQNPHSIIWAVRSDGILLGLTYVREHQMWAWHRHDFTDAEVENVCAVPEGTEDALYLVVKRTINGATKRYIERMDTRQIGDIEDAIFVDCGLSYDGRHAGSTTMTLSGGSAWLSTETLTLTASATFFSASDVGNAIHLVGSDGTLIRFTITGFTSGTVVTGKPHKTVPVSMRNVAIAVWSRAVDELTGLWHLEGKQVSILADGFVVANPNNPAYTVRTVTNGTVTLDKPYAVVHVGLPYTSDMETLDIDTAVSETLADKKMLITKVTMFVESSRGIWVGGQAPTSDVLDPDELTEMKLRSDENYDEPPDLKTGEIDVNIRGEWNSNGRVFIRQSDPIPLSVLAVVPGGLVPFRG